MWGLLSFSLGLLVGLGVSAIVFTAFCAAAVAPSTKLLPRTMEPTDAKKLRDVLLFVPDGAFVHVWYLRLRTMQARWVRNARGKPRWAHVDAPRFYSLN